MLVTSKKIDFYAKPYYRYVATVPKGAEVHPATNMPKKNGKCQYWVEKWPNMSLKAISFHNTYGFLIEHDEVEEILEVVETIEPVDPANV